MSVYKYEVLGYLTLGQFDQSEGFADTEGKNRNFVFGIAKAVKSILSGKTKETPPFGGVGPEILSLAGFTL